MKILQIFLVSFLFHQFFATPMLPFFNLQAGDTIQNGLGFALLVPSQKTLNFTLTTYSKLNQANWLTITYLNTMTYANVSIPVGTFGCNIQFNQQRDLYQGNFSVRSNQDDIEVEFNVRSNDADLKQFNTDLKNLCGNLLQEVVVS